VQVGTGGGRRLLSSLSHHTRHQKHIPYSHSAYHVRHGWANSHECWGRCGADELIEHAVCSRRFRTTHTYIAAYTYRRFTRHTDGLKDIQTVHKTHRPVIRRTDRLYDALAPDVYAHSHPRGRVRLPVDPDMHRLWPIHGSVLLERRGGQSCWVIVHSRGSRTDDATALCTRQASCEDVGAPRGGSSMLVSICTAVLARDGRMLSVAMSEFAYTAMAVSAAGGGGGAPTSAFDQEEREEEHACGERRALWCRSG
jgi:hypothetical protein